MDGWAEGEGVRYGRIGGRRYGRMGGWRNVDYRMLNTQTVRDRFPTPTAGDLIAKTRGAQLFSKIDLLSGFHQLRMSDDAVRKTAFATPSGLYEFVSAPLLD